MELNLRPASVARSQELAKQRPYLVMAGICLLLSLLGFWFYFFKAASVEGDVLEKMKPQITMLQGIETRFKNEMKTLKASQDSAVPYTQLVEDRQFWSRILDDLNARLPERSIWVTSFGPVGTGTGVAGAKTGGVYSSVTLKGLYINTQPLGAGVVDDFVKNLSQSPLYSKATAAVRATPNDADWAFNYEIQLELKNPIKTQ